MILETGRLILRAWRDTDREPFARMNADPAVMRYLPACLDREQSDAFAGRIEAEFRERGFGLFAAELPGQAAFIGYIGLSVPRFAARFTPCVEIGWRLAAAFWNRGLAAEGAREVLCYAWERLGLDEVVSFTTRGNAASRRVMEKIGLTRDPAGDFEHPSLPVGHPLRPHVLYRGRRTAIAAPR